jgi:hypothetical protein
MRKRGKIIPFPGRPPDPAASREPGAPPTPARKPLARRPPTDEPRLVEIHRCDQAEALVLRSLFESEGIPTLFRSRLVSSVHPFSVGAQGEVVVLVPESEAARSRRLRLEYMGGLEGPPTPPGARGTLA